MLDESLSSDIQELVIDAHKTDENNLTRLEPDL